MYQGIQNDNVRPEILDGEDKLNELAFNDDLKLRLAVIAFLFIFVLQVIVHFGIKANTRISFNSTFNAVAQDLPVNYDYIKCYDANGVLNVRNCKRY